VAKTVRLPRFGKIHTIGYYAFSFWAILRAWWRFRVLKEPRPDVIYSTGWYMPSSDVIHVHFSPWDWERRQRVLGIHALRDLFERLTNLVSLAWSSYAVRRTTAHSVLCVSEAIAADVRACNATLPTVVLPNCYDPARFHPEVRALHREATRTALRFAPEDKVLIFVSTGHYRRKGFFLAAQALQILRQSHSNARLLVVGGLERRLQELQSRLDHLHPDWRDWISFTGMVPDVEKYFAAADGFLLPSYSEAFALVEVEAAACGLPLFLTRHHGSEMILEDGRNGRFVEFDAAHIAGVLAEFVSGQWKPLEVHALKALNKTEYAHRLAAELLAVGNSIPESEKICSPAIPAR
jgi:glycosyltransferase involved in cell wall biosynthesis